jgi:hypothetical protein
LTNDLGQKRVAELAIFVLDELELYGELARSSVPKQIRANQSVRPDSFLSRAITICRAALFLAAMQGSPAHRSAAAQHLERWAVLLAARAALRSAQ